MTEREDNRLVDYLYGEMADKDRQAFEEVLHEDAKLSESVHGFESLLETIRSADLDEAPSHLDALLMAQARKKTEAKTSWLSQWLRRPGLSLAFSGACALVLAVLVIPQMQSSDSTPGTELAAPEFGAKSEAVAAKAMQVDLQDEASDSKNTSAHHDLVKAEEESPASGSAEIRPKRLARATKRSAAPAKTIEPLMAPLGSVGAKRKANKESSAPVFDGRSQVVAIKAPVDLTKKKRRAKPTRETLAGLENGAEDLSLDSARLGRVHSASPPPASSVVIGGGGGSMARSAAPVAVEATEEMDEHAAVRPKAAPQRRARQDRASAAEPMAKSAPSDREAWARALARKARLKAKKLLAVGRIGAAREVYLQIRPTVRNTMAFFELSLWLAQLEYAQGRFVYARQYAQEASRSRDQRIQAKAREVVARVRQDESPTKTMPASSH